MRAGGPLTPGDAASGLVVDFLLARVLTHVAEPPRGAAGGVFEAFRNPGSSLGQGGTASAAAREAARHLVLIPPAALAQVRWAFAAFDGGPSSLPRDSSALITPWVGPAVNVAMGLY
jgi:hypothetical protein